ncbi:alpha/beta fold hydrolase, partial [Acinetobacter baumannii]
PETPAFLYLHGNPGSRHEVVRPGYLEAFGRARHRVIAIDRPGYGDSDPPRERGHAALAPDIEALLDHLGIDRALAIGNSRGTLPAIGLGALL